MLQLLRKHRWFFFGTTLAGFALRLIFLSYFPAVTDDSRIYAELATNWMQHGVYGQAQGSQIVPTDARLPGYPAFLACIFLLFGAGNFKAVMLVQVALDLATCFLVADLARRLVSEPAAKISFVLAALCPFLANYAAAALTETLEMFFTALSFDLAAAASERMAAGDDGARMIWAATGISTGCCILLRPDGGLVLAAILFFLAVTASKTATPRGSLQSIRTPLLSALIVALFGSASLAPWALRNLRTLHQFQPLAPRYANNTDELVPRGFIRWTKTWIADYASVEEIYWNVPGDTIDAEKLPSRAFDNPAEKDATLAVIEEYNSSKTMTPELDARFATIAGERIAAHPIRYYFELPLLRVADMWLRPRTEILPPDVRWWEFTDDAKYVAVGLGFGLLNLAYLAAALWTLFRRSARVRWIALPILFFLLRSALLLTLENPEPRYTLECYPFVIVLAAACLTRPRPALQTNASSC